MKYGTIDVDAFIADHIASSPERTPFEIYRDHLAYEALRCYQDFGIDPIVLFQAALDKLNVDAMIIVNRMPTLA
jgi:hypothetical protein